MGLSSGTRPPPSCTRLSPGNFCQERFARESQQNPKSEGCVGSVPSLKCKVTLQSSEEGIRLFSPEVAVFRGAAWLGAACGSALRAARRRRSGRAALGWRGRSLLPVQLGVRPRREERWAEGPAEPLQPRGAFWRCLPEGAAFSRL